MKTATKQPRRGNNPKPGPFLQRKRNSAPHEETPFISPKHTERIQPKLNISQPGDEYEQEADRAADQVMRMTDESVLPPMISRLHSNEISLQRMCSECENEIQRKTANQGHEYLTQGTPVSTAIIAQRKLDSDSNNISVSSETPVKGLSAPGVNSGGSARRELGQREVISRRPDSRGNSRKVRLNFLYPEQEADRVAEHVVNTPDSVGPQFKPVSNITQGHSVQRVTEAEENKRVLQGPHEPFEGSLEKEEEVIRRMPHVEEDEKAVMGQMPIAEEEGGLQKMPLEGEEETEEEEAVPGQQMQSNRSAVSSVNPAVARNIDNLSVGGKPLPKSVRSSFEPWFGADFSKVRVHTDARAARIAKVINARAFTVGSNIGFGVGEYSPATTSGRRTLAHELTHVVQQRRRGRGQVERPLVQRLGDPSQVPSGLACPMAYDSPGISDLDVMFRLNSSRLGLADSAAIDNLVNNWRVTGANEDLRVDGYASTDGPDRLNWRLSCARALAVRSALVSPLNGRSRIPFAHIKVYAHGETSEFGAANPPNRRATIQLRGAPPTPRPPQGPAQATVIPCTATPREIFSRGRCASGTDFTHHDFQPLTGVSRYGRALVWQADNLSTDFRLRNEMRLELGALGRTEGLRMVTHFSGGTGTQLTHGSSSTLGSLALISGTFSRLHIRVIREIERQLTRMAATGVIDCNAVTLPPAGVPVVSFTFADDATLKAIIGGTQGLHVRIRRFGVNPRSRSYAITLQYLICDDFGVDTADLYSPGLAAFWVLQHRRAGYVPFVNELSLPKTAVGRY
jgi:outer membrane protein OmpA-like peptidoglycan-associated protein